MSAGRIIPLLYFHVISAAGLAITLQSMFKLLVFSTVVSCGSADVVGTAEI